MGRRKKDKSEYILELKDLETLSTEEIFEKYGCPSRKIPSRISRLRAVLETYDFPSPPDWFEANGDHIHEMVVYSEEHGYNETFKHFRVSYTIQRAILEYKKAHPDLFELNDHNVLPDITVGVCKLYDQHKDVEKVLDVFIKEMHLEDLEYRRQTTLRSCARSALEKYKGEVLYTKSKIFKDKVHGELTRDFIMEVVEYNRVNGYEVCKEKYFLDRDFRYINSSMYGACKRFDIDTNLWIVPIRESEFNLQREKAVETINYYYAHGGEATVKRYKLNYKTTICKLIDRWKRKFGLVDMYRGRRALR